MIQLKKHINWVLGAVFLLFIFLGLFIYKNINSQPDTVISPEQMPVIKNETETIDSKTEKNEEESVSSSQIMIDVQGSVHRPGVYEMNNGDRVIDVIRKAGGFLEEAETRSVNQAEKIVDEMIIYVAGKGEEVHPLSSDKGNDKGDLLNINSADLSELQTLSGVGPSKAQSIISYREEFGPFKTIDQLLKVRGIGEKTIEEWKDKIKFQ
ncbi:helix-hairpin-helix domain-containing protein [Fictibacillus halophilus]|uniref:helix-hairpin-helix domain-containing protein n=1 Tax=Fictibacillus halophilus TaxID=1610490 RepID=UPI001CFAD610|nr:helix-hairpin-helix domain-containing protein [Fictibacillus halophilus]